MIDSACAPGVVHDELIQPVLGLAREQKYAQAISALLNKTNNWIAAKDRSTAAVTEALVTASLPNATTNPPDVADHGVVLAQPSPFHSKSRAGCLRSFSVYWPRRSRWPPWSGSGIGIVAPAIDWLAGSRRSGPRLSKSWIGSMGSRNGSNFCRRRLDLTRRWPVRPWLISSPLMRSVGKLWDGWLQIMEMLDKAQKLEAKAGSPLSTKALSDVEEMVERQGSFAEIETQAQASATELDALTQAHTFVRDGSRCGRRSPAQDRRGDGLGQEAQSPDGAL